MSPIDLKYQQLGGLEGWFGTPAHEERPTPDGLGLYRTYRQKNGWLTSIYWHPRYGSRELHGVIRKKWEKMGYENSFLGYPISDEVDAIENNEIVGKMSLFEGGAIVWYHQTDKWVVLKTVEDRRLLVYERQRTTEQEAERMATYAAIAIKLARAAFGA